MLRILLIIFGELSMCFEREKWSPFLLGVWALLSICGFGIPFSQNFCFTQNALCKSPCIRLDKLLYKGGNSHANSHQEREVWMRATPVLWPKASVPLRPDPVYHAPAALDSLPVSLKSVWLFVLINKAWIVLHTAFTITNGDIKLIPPILSSRIASSDCRVFFWHYLVQSHSHPVRQVSRFSSFGH